MPRETAEEFAKRVWALMQNCYMNDVANVIADRDRETAKAVRERVQKYIENHGAGINSIAELNEALGFTMPIDLPADNKICPKCEGRGCWGTGKVDG